MCYNIVYLEKRAINYYERYKDILPPAFSYSQGQLYNQYFHVSGFEHPLLPIVRYDGIFLYQWGLIPGWVKDDAKAKEMQKMTLNCVGETAFVKPSFRKSISTKRCLLGVNGFYEWRDYNKVKYPYFIKVKDSSIFSLGCIYENWVDKNSGEIHNTFSIITTPANPLMEKIHNIKKRMPLIIDRMHEKDWINPSLSTEAVKNLIVPYDEKKMVAYTVSRSLNDVRLNRNIPEILDEVKYAELAD